MHLLLDPVIAAAAYILLGVAPAHTTVPSHVAPACQLPPAPASAHGVSGHMTPVALAATRPAPRPGAGNHMTVRWRGGWHHHRHCHRVGRHWRCR